MKTSALLKHTGLAAVALTVAIGCSTSPTAQTEEPPAPAEQKGISQDAIDAIARAKAARYRVNGLGCEWDDTGALIEEAEAQGNQGRNFIAIDMASQAEKRALAALEECEKAEAEPETTTTTVVVDSGATSYTVAGGDTLWGIAAMDEIYADPYQWPLIYRLNSDQITDADLIYPGQVFSIDRSPTTAQVDAAIAHAKSRGAWSVGVVEDSDRAYLGQ